MEGLVSININGASHYIQILILLSTITVPHEAILNFHLPSLLSHLSSIIITHHLQSSSAEQALYR